VRREGIVLREPSVVAKRVDRGGILAVGERGEEDDRPDAGRYSRHPALRDGVIADFDTAFETADGAGRSSGRGWSSGFPNPPGPIIPHPSATMLVSSTAVMAQARLRFLPPIVRVGQPSTISRICSGSVRTMPGARASVSVVNANISAVDSNQASAPISYPPTVTQRFGSENPYLNG